MLIRVVLPEPFGPTSATYTPGRHVQVAVTQAPDLAAVAVPQAAHRRAVLMRRRPPCGGHPG